MLKTEFHLRVLTSQISPNGSQEPSEVGEKTEVERKIIITKTVLYTLLICRWHNING
ncbi:unnamed protein product [Prunus brigantina]